METGVEPKTKKQIFSEKLQEKWRPIIRQWRESGQTQRGFCRAHNHVFHQFTYWKRRFMDPIPGRGTKPVKVFDSDLEKGKPSTPQEPAQERSGVRVFFRDFCLEVEPDFSEEMLLKVVQTLRRA